jgi:acyl-CoA reductase-like NAD-dependent aldehyde dehydrogenase
MSDRRTPLQVHDLVVGQRAYFLSGATRPIEWRVRQLEAMKAMFEENRAEMFAALRQDLRRNDVDSDIMDVAFCINEADYALKHLREWIEPSRADTLLIFEPGHVRIRRDPLGVTLIIGPWNEPFELLFAPLVPAIAAGNTAVLKPSDLVPNVSSLVARLVAEYMDPQAFAVVEGGVPETSALLEEKWDLVFFTGSPQVGMIVHQAAAKNLTPCVLELGGKNPTVVHSSADIRTAARRIAFGRFVNGGQLCTAPDHVLVWPEVHDELVAELKEATRAYYGNDPQKSPDYGRVINRKAFDRLQGLLECGKPVIGGQTDAEDLYIAPTVLVNVAWDSPIMQEEIFGPILPILEVESVEAVIAWVNSIPSPLGLYVFTEEDDVAEQILAATSSGDAVVNDCAVHPVVPELPFGGVGTSGMGKYHGHWGFEAFTNARGVLYHSALIGPAVKYPPYAKHKLERKVEMKLLHRTSGLTGGRGAGRLSIW